MTLWRTPRPGRPRRVCAARSATSSRSRSATTAACSRSRATHRTPWCGTSPREASLRILRSPVSGGRGRRRVLPVRRPRRDRRRRHARRSRPAAVYELGKRPAARQRPRARHAPGPRLQRRREAARERRARRRRPDLERPARRLWSARSLRCRRSSRSVSRPTAARSRQAGSSGNVDFWNAAGRAQAAPRSAARTALVISVSYDPERQRADDHELRRQAQALGSPLAKARRRTAPRARRRRLGNALPRRRPRDRGLPATAPASSGTPTRGLEGTRLPRRPPQSHRSGVARLPARARLPPNLLVDRHAYIPIAWYPEST